MTPEGDGIYPQSADGSGSPERVLENPARFLNPRGFTPEGRQLFVSHGFVSVDIGVVTLDGTRELEVLLDSPFDENNSEVSPGG